MTGNSVRSFTPFVRGLVAAAALATVFTSIAGDIQSGIQAAAVMGVLAALSASFVTLGHVASVVYSVIGAVAFVPTVLSFVRADDCTSLPAPGFRIAACVLFVAIAAMSGFASVVSLQLRLDAALGLGILGGFDILVGIATFLATGTSVADWTVTSAMVAAAAPIGWLAVRNIDGVLSLAAIALVGQTLLSAAAGNSCRAPNFSGTALLAGFCVVYFVIRALTGFITRR